MIHKILRFGLFMPVLLTMLSACGSGKSNNLKGYEWLEGKWEYSSPEGYLDTYLVITPSYYQSFRPDFDYESTDIMNQPKEAYSIALEHNDFVGDVKMIGGLYCIDEARKQVYWLYDFDQRIYLEKVDAFKYSDSQEKSSQQGFPSGIADVHIRADIKYPSFPSRQTIPFPLNETFVSSEDNFVIDGGSNTYFAYIPSEQWGVYSLTFKEGFSTCRYIYCTGYDNRTKQLTLSVYNPDGSYIGEMVGNFNTDKRKAVYDCVFTNSKGYKSEYHIVQD